MSQLDASQRPALYLASHVRACTLSDQVVLLDLHRSRYLALGIKQWEALRGALLPHGARETSGAQHQRNIEQLAAPLLRQRILTRSPARAAQTDHAQLPEASLDVAGEMPFSKITAARIWRFAVAATWSAAALRLFSLQRVVARVGKRVARLGPLPVERQGDLREAVAAFDTLRPLLFTARDKCLYDSLALVSFLASEGLRAQWIVGVQAGPFAAHSWVQSGNVVLNDLHESVGDFRPILVV